MENKITKSGNRLQCFVSEESFIGDFCIQLNEKVKCMSSDNGNDDDGDDD